MNNTINRLIIIGNGFDLAHGMKTKYKDFVTWYVKQRIGKHIGNRSSKETKDELMSIIQPKDSVEMLLRYYEELTPKQNLDKVKQYGYEVKLSPFFETIIEKIENKNWVDIECEYYKYLCSLLKELELSDEEDTKKKVSKKIDDLNEEMKFITKKLVEYLKKEDRGPDENYIRIDEEPFRREILHKMMMPLSKQEIAVESLKFWDSFVKEKYSIVRKEDDPEAYSQYKRDNGELNIEWLMEKEHPKELRPGEIVILNFNYTSLAAAYHTRIADNSKYKTYKGTAYLNQIHGTLYGKEKIIFGYGNTQDKNFPKLKQNDKFLENIKPMRYRTSFLYPHVLKFIGDAPFQVCIMGHSCGESDRTLLRDIFQHKKCISIKPYYWEYSKDKNNYQEIYNNIFRCFDDETLIGTKIVCQDYCEPLPQPGKKKE